MSPPGAAPWRPERFCFIAAVPSASTGVTAQDKVDRLEARTAFLLAEPDARREAAVVAEPGAQQVAAVAAVSYAQQAAVVTPGAVAMKSRVRSLVASVEPAEPAAVRLWFRATMVSAAALEPALVPAAKVQAAADRWPVASRLLMATVVRLIPATVVRLWFPARPASAPGQEPAAKVQAPADP